jgi:hypothetical protein
VLDELELAVSSEEIVGWRVWRVARPVERRATAQGLARELLEAERRGATGVLDELFEHRLRSLTEQTFWPGEGRFTGSCRAEPPTGHEAPGVRCECGIWAFRDRAPAEATVAAYVHCGSPVAYGRVALWGRVVEHERGWRGQYARPLELHLCGAADDIAWELVEAYGLPVELAPWPEADPAASSYAA